MNKLISLLAISVLLTACGEGRYITTGANTSTNPNRYRPEGNRVVIFSASVNMSVHNVDTLNNELVRIAQRYNGYVVKLGDKQSTIRVQAAQLENALHDIGIKGKKKGTSKTGQDVTDDYQDYNTRLENANKARNRYLELLAKAENVEATLKVEKELERLNGEIEILKGKIEKLKHLADYATIDVNIKRKHKLGLFGYIGVGIYKAVKWLIVRD